MSIAARNILLDEGGVELPTAFIDFNITGVSRQSRYFNSGVVPSSTTSVEIMFVKNPNPAIITGFQSGCRTGWVNGAMQINMDPRNKYFWFAWNSATNIREDTESFPMPEYAIVTFDFGGHVSVKGINPTASYSYDFNQNYSSSRSNTFFIGDSNENGTAKGRTDSQGSGRIAWVKFYEGGVLTHNFVASQSNDSPVFLDKVTGNVIQSAGTAAASTIRYVSLTA